MVKRAIVLALVACAMVYGIVNAQSNTRVYTLSFNHDGIGTDSYVADVDGVRVTITPNCVGEGDARLCTSPITLTYGVQHSVKVIAVGLFGEGVSVPFVCSIPKGPGNPRVVK